MKEQGTYLTTKDSGQHKDNEWPKYPYGYYPRYNLLQNTDVDDIISKGTE